MKRYIVWRNAEKTQGFIVDDAQLAYEMRKGASNTLGMIEYELLEAWNEATVDDDCIIEEVTL